MSDHHKQIERLQTYLAHVNERIAGYEATAEQVKGRLSEAFANRLADARAERDRLEKNIKALRREDALEWSDAHAGILQVCEEIGHRLDEALTHLEHHEK